MTNCSACGAGNRPGGRSCAQCRRNDPDAPAEARSIYADLGAGRWLERIEEESGVVG